MSLLYIFLFLLYGLVQCSGSPLQKDVDNSRTQYDLAVDQLHSFDIQPTPTAVEVEFDPESTLYAEPEIEVDAAPAVTEAAAAPEVYLATNIDPTKTDCRTDCAVGLPAATVYKWQQVTITATTVVETLVHVINPQYYPNATGTRRIQQKHDSLDEQRDRYSIDNGVVFTTLDLGYRRLGVTFPTPVTVTPTTLTLIGGPPATVAQETPTCTSAAVQSVNLTTIEQPKLFDYGDIETGFPESSIGNLSISALPTKVVRDTVHWRLVPEVYRQVDVAQFRSQFPYIMALDICGAFGPPEQTAAITPMSGKAWATVTLTETFTESGKDPRFSEIITMTKKAGTSLDGPRPLSTVRVESSVTAAAPIPQKSGIAQQMVSETSQGPSGLLIGPAPKPAPVEQQIEFGGLPSSAKLMPKPAVATPNASPVMVNGHIITPKGSGLWEVDDGQLLKLNGPDIELNSGGHGGSGHKMKVGLTSGGSGKEVLVVDGASMTLSAGVSSPRATGSSSKSGKSSSGSSDSLKGQAKDSSPNRQPDASSAGKSPTQFKGAAPCLRQNMTSALLIVLAAAYFVY